MVSVNGLLDRLPSFKGVRDVVEADQTTTDIIKEVLDAHKFFASDYDLISECFLESGLVTKKLYDFCKKNLRYKIETEDLQTTRSPTAILRMQNIGCDCKHYAGFISGVLDSLNRKGLANYNWAYRFASYNIFNSEAKHVFVVVKEKNGNEIWIDPVLDEYDSREPSPYYTKDKKPKMALERISGVQPKDFITSNTVVRRADANNYMGCNCSKAAPLADGSINGFDIQTFIQHNPLQALLVGGVAGFIIYKIFA